MIMNNDFIPSPILFMEFIRQTTIGECLKKDNVDCIINFKLAKKYYDEIMNYHQKQQLINLEIQYNNEDEILTVKTNNILINRFKEHKSMVENALKFYDENKDRYKNFINVI